MDRISARLVALSAALASSAACAPAIELTVDLRTDLVPGVEFTAVRTTLAPSYAAGTRPSGRSFDHSVFFGDPVAAGVRVAELGGVTTGQSYVVVELLDAHGTVVAVRPVSIAVTASLALTVVVTRDCRDVHCPLPSDSASALACFGGRCVDPTCGSGGSCGLPACGAASDCIGGSSCTVASCVDGACLYAGGTCATGLYCDPTAGCLPEPDHDAGSTDAGAPDGGAPDGGAPDSGPRDGGGTDAGGTGSLACNTPILLGPASHVAAASDGTGVVVVWNWSPDITAQRFEAGGVAQPPRGTTGPDCSVMHVAQRASGFVLGCTIGTASLAVTPLDVHGATASPSITTGLDGIGGFAFLVDDHSVGDTPGIAWVTTSGTVNTLHQGSLNTDGSFARSMSVTVSGVDMWPRSLVGARYGARSLVAFTGTRTAAYAQEWIAFGGGAGEHTGTTGTVGGATAHETVGVATTSTAPSALRFVLVETQSSTVDVVGIDGTGNTNGGGGPFTSGVVPVVAITGVPYVPSGGYRFVWTAADGVHHGRAGVDVTGAGIPVSAGDDGAFHGHTSVAELAIGAIGYTEYVVAWVEAGNAWVTLGCD